MKNVRCIEIKPVIKLNGNITDTIWSSPRYHVSRYECKIWSVVIINRTPVVFRGLDIYRIVGGIHGFGTQIPPVICRPNFNLSNKNSRVHFAADKKNRPALREAAVKGQKKSNQ